MIEFSLSLKAPFNPLNFIAGRIKSHILSESCHLLNLHEIHLEMFLPLHTIQRTIFPITAISCQNCLYIPWNIRQHIPQKSIVVPQCLMTIYVYVYVCICEYIYIYHCIRISLSYHIKLKIYMMTPQNIRLKIKIVIFTHPVNQSH